MFSGVYLDADQAQALRLFSYQYGQVRTPWTVFSVRYVQKGLFVISKQVDNQRCNRAILRLARQADVKRSPFLGEPGCAGLYKVRIVDSG